LQEVIPEKLNISSGMITAAMVFFISDNFNCSFKYLVPCKNKK
jgi:hypothetical protein